MFDHRGCRDVLGVFRRSARGLRSDPGAKSLRTLLKEELIATLTCGRGLLATQIAQELGNYLGLLQTTTTGGSTPSLS